MHTRFVLVLAALSLLAVPIATATPGGSGAPSDHGVTTFASAEAKITAVIWDQGDPNDDDDGTCEIWWMEKGDVAGYLNTVPYTWSVPGGGGTSSGPVYDWNQVNHQEVVEEGEWFGSKTTSSWIAVDGGPAPDLDEATATDSTGSVKCTEDASVPDPDNVSPEKLTDCIEDIRIQPVVEDGSVAMEEDSCF